MPTLVYQGIWSFLSATSVARLLMLDAFLCLSLSSHSHVGYGSDLWEVLRYDIKDGEQGVNPTRGVG